MKKIGFNNNFDIKNEFEVKKLVDNYNVTSFKYEVEDDNLKYKVESSIFSKQDVESDLVENLDKLYKDTIGEEREKMLETVENILGTYGTLPYSWFIGIVEYLKSMTITVIRVGAQGCYTEEISLASICDGVSYPVLLCSGLRAAVYANRYLWNAIYNSLALKFQVVQFNRFMGKSLGKSFIRGHIREKINSALIAKNLRVVQQEKTVEGIIKKIMNNLKGLYR